MKCDNSELKLNKDNATSMSDIVVSALHECGKGVFGFCIQTPAV